MGEGKAEGNFPADGEGPFPGLLAGGADPDDEMGDPQGGGVGGPALHGILRPDGEAPANGLFDQQLASRAFLNPDDKFLRLQGRVGEHVFEAFRSSGHFLQAAPPVAGPITDERARELLQFHLRPVGQEDLVDGKGEELGAQFLVGNLPEEGVLKACFEAPEIQVAFGDDTLVDGGGDTVGMVPQARLAGSHGGENPHGEQGEQEGHHREGLTAKR